MNTIARQRLQEPDPSPRRLSSNGNRRTCVAVDEGAVSIGGGPLSVGKARVFIAAENRLLREVLSRMLGKVGSIDVVGMDAPEPFRTEDLLREKAEILVLTSRGAMNEDLLAIRRVRVTAPNVQIMLIGMTGAGTEFLQCVRAGVRGYFPREASAKDVVEGDRKSVV